jgi:hypothetical protein
LRDLPQQKKIPRELWGGDPAIFICSHVPIERFFDGTDRKNSKTQKNGGKKKKIFYFILNVCGGPHTGVFSICQEHPWASALGRPSLRRTHSYGNLP